MNSSYRAHAFHPSLGSRTATGQLELSGGRLRFESKDGQVELPLDGLTLRWGGNNREQIFIEHAAQPDWSIYTSDKGILNEAAFTVIPGLDQQIKSMRRRRTAPIGLIVAAAVLGLALLVSLIVFFASKDRLVRSLAFRIPIASEIELGNSLFEQIKRDGRIVSDAQLEAQLKTAVSRLLPAVANGGYTFQFHLLDDTNANAFAIPGGNVVVHTGLLRMSERPEEIAGVLAHEIAHVTQKHGFRKIIDSAGLYLLIRTLVGDTGGLASVVADGSKFLLQQKYSRNFEQEADDVGWQYLIEAKVDPRGLIEFFKKLRTVEGRAGQIPAFLGTHPATEERIKRLEAKWEALPDKTGFITLRR
jgi:predicted Zn-dependent protease